MKTLRNLFALAILFISLSAPVFAYPITPEFPVCSNPQGELKSEYSSGTHGIPGDTSSYTGSDKVYTVSNNTLIQCFCPENGNGIQTNWWKIDFVIESLIETYKNLGWIYVPDGSVWGLEQAPYLAQNLSYSCKGDGVGGPSPSGDILSEGISTSNVLGLAGTGDSLRLFLLGIAGLVFMSIGVLNRRHEKR